MPIAFILAVVLVLIVCYTIYDCRRPRNFPPGPFWLPIVGNIPQLKKLSILHGGQHLALQELAAKYKTKVLGLKLAKTKVIVVFSYDVVRKVLKEEEYEGRPRNFFMKLRCLGRIRGITATDGESWKTQRNFVVSHLRMLGLGKSKMDDLVKEELSEIHAILDNCGDNVEIGTFLAPAVINILWKLVSGIKIERCDPKLNKLLKLLGLRSKAFDMSGGTIAHYPWMRFIAPEKIGYNLILKLNAELENLLMDTIMHHKKSWTEGNCDDLIYAFLTEGNEKPTFTDDELVMVCLDLFIAGSQTTSSTLNFAYLRMILHPDIQEKVRECLIDALGKEGEITFADRYRVPYVEAVLNEVERYHNVVPIDGPRRVLRDTVLEGYTIPKDTTVLLSFHSVHHDEEYWKDPDVFRPERFLDTDGKLISSDRLIPFGLGKRRCLGEILARNCIFVLFANIIRRYKVSVTPGTRKPTGVPLMGITLIPEDYRASFTKI